MNCPSCSAPLLFGASSCACGYPPVRARSVIGVSYWKAVRAYWRIYWPPLTFGIALLCNANWLGVYNISFVVLSTALIVLLSAALFLLVPRLVSGPRGGFSLIVVATSNGETGRHLRLDQRARVWLFLWWRHLAASLLTCLLAVLLSNMLVPFLAVSGLNLLEVLGAAGGVLIIVQVLAHVFIIGPVLVKMLVGKTFADFWIEARCE